MSEPQHQTMGQLGGKGDERQVQGPRLDSSPPNFSEYDALHDEWRVVDRWWTDDPISREYREVTRDGRRFVEMREGDAGEWTEVVLP